MPFPLHDPSRPKLRRAPSRSQAVVEQDLAERGTATPRVDSLPAFAILGATLVQSTIPPTFATDAVTLAVQVIDIRADNLDGPSYAGPFPLPPAQSTSVAIGTPGNSWLKSGVRRKRYPYPGGGRLIAFCLVHRMVGAPDELLRVRLLAGDRQPDASADSHQFVSQANRSGNGRNYPLTDEVDLNEPRVEESGGPPGSHRTERDSLPSLRSSHRSPANVRTHRQCVNSPGSRSRIPGHQLGEPSGRSAAVCTSCPPSASGRC